MAPTAPRPEVYADGPLILERAAAMNWRKTASPSAVPPARTEKPKRSGRAWGSTTRVLRLVRGDHVAAMAVQKSGIGRRWPANPPRTCQVRTVNYFFFFAAFFFVAFFFAAFLRAAISDHLPVMVDE